jgi:hypothetical protein
LHLPGHPLQLLSQNLQLLLLLGEVSVQVVEVGDGGGFFFVDVFDPEFLLLDLFPEPPEILLALGNPALHLLQVSLTDPAACPAHDRQDRETEKDPYTRRYLPTDT